MNTRSLIRLVAVVMFIICSAACSDSDPMRSEEPTYLIQSWHVDANLPSPPQFPTTLGLSVRVSEVSSSGTSMAPDGTSVTFQTTAGQFDGGVTIIQVPTAGGAASTPLTVGAPGSATVTARVGTTQSTTVVTVNDSGSIQLGN